MTTKAIAQPKKNLPPPAAAPCPMITFVDLVAGKWAIPILYRLIVIDAPVRFGELQRGVYPITQKELTRQLRAFETKGLVRRTQFAEIPPRVEYQVTDLGKTLKAPLQSLAGWVNAHQDDLRA
ncbi:winged helix-turn-helix transcriptional regulator [Acerihabitans arboris]|uniref:Transcriptional regulator n=1 Tax=Acerihabitans arboris TaxID=2691583 RepID=A0A845SFR6_9GAMM|nr:helix-turn-helix domain-containing protein [Acerihabitans arboris]NDL61548.1 transcriptional regulator [Acerihabitans arboris]